MRHSRDSLYIDGAWSKPLGSDAIVVISPSTEEAVARVPHASQDDVDAAVGAAHASLDHASWRRMPLSERTEVVRRMGEILCESADELATLTTLQNGMPIRFTSALTPSYEGIFRASCDVAAQVEFAGRRQGLYSSALLERDPIGVVAAIVPWNGPVYLALTTCVPALLAGCSVILKPAPETPLEAYVMADAAHRAGVPAGVFNVLPADREVSGYLAAHPGVNLVSFTGSTETGKKIIAASGDKIGRVSLELGGKSPAVVLDDADVDETVVALVKKMSLNSGQVCGNLSRVLVPAHLERRYADAIAEEYLSLPMGDPFAPDTMMGPLVASRQRDRVEGYIAAGRREGAELVAGGGRPANLPRGWYVEPTVFSGVDNRMTIAREEIFGPVVSIIAYQDDEHAVEIANDTTYGLTASVYGSDPARALGIARRLDAGTVSFENPVPDPAIPRSPHKGSGIATDGGPEGFDRFLQLKTLVGFTEA